MGNGSHVFIDVDPVVGMGSSFILPAELRAYLADYGICTLEQARNNTSFATGYLFTAEELDLCEEWKYHWETYIRGLEYNRIRLKDLRDSLLWSHSNYVGPLSAARGYDSIFLIDNLEEHNSVLDSLWALKILTKLVCFSWLLLNERILTWDHLQTCGYFGPSRCILCERNSEDIRHIFLFCPFTVKILSYFSVHYGFSLPSFNSH